MQITTNNVDCFNGESNQYPVIFSLPHSGTHVPQSVRQTMKDDVILANSDWFLRELYDFIPDLGFTTIQNNINRYVADPNRKNTIVDNADYRYNSVYQQNTFGNQIYQEELNKDQIDQRMQEFYDPYHHELQRLIDYKHNDFDDIYLIDLHSFARYPGFEMMSPADFVIGNNYDSTSSERIRMWLTNELKRKDYTVSDNFPFTGGHITKHYGTMDNLHSIQLEIRYNVYLEDREYVEEEVTSYDSELFMNAKNNLKKIIQLFEAKMR